MKIGHTELFFSSTHGPAVTIRQHNAVSILAHRLRRWPSIKSAKQWNQSQKTQDICITFLQCRHNVFDVGSTLYKCYTNVLCLLVALRLLWGTLSLHP